MYSRCILQTNTPYYPASHAHFQMNLQGILKTDDLITRFFRLSTQMCVDMCYRTLSEQSASLTPTMVRSKCFRTLDAFVRLIALLVKHSGESPQAVSKINLLNKVGRPAGLGEVMGGRVEVGRRRGAGKCAGPSPRPDNPAPAHGGLVATERHSVPTRAADTVCHRLACRLVFGVAAWPDLALASVR